MMEVEDTFRGETIYSNIYARTVIRQGYMKQVEICDDNGNVILFPNKTAVGQAVKELQRILENWG